MRQYAVIEEAMAALTSERGTGAFDNTKTFIALLCDYAPNLANEQRPIRAYLRAGGGASLKRAAEGVTGVTEALSEMCPYIADASPKFDEQKFILKTLRGYISIVRGKSDGGLFEAGMDYFRRFPKERNIPIALLLFDAAAAEGNTDALYYTASCYLKGKGVAKNETKGINYLEKAASLCNRRAMSELAERLKNGSGTAKDTRRAVELFKKLGGANAMFEIGGIYRDWNDNENAFNYFLKAALDGHVYAQYETAMAFAVGRGTARNMAEAKRWLKSAAALGHSGARQKLAEIGETW